MTSIVGLTRAAHIEPTIAVTTLAEMLSFAFDLDRPRLALTTATVFAGQLVIDWSNDLLDAARDTAAHRSDLWRRHSKYLDAVPKETLRIRPVVFDIGLVLREPVELAGYQLPARVMVVAGIHFIHSDSEVYPDAETDCVGTQPVPRSVRPPPR